MTTRIVPLLVLSLFFAAPTHAATLPELEQEITRLTAELSALQLPPQGSGAVLGVSTASSTKRLPKGKSSISVKVKNLPDDWRAENGITLYLYDNETSAWVKGAIVKKGKARFTGLQKNHEYYLMLNGVAGGEKRVVTTKKRNTKVTFTLPDEEEEQAYDEQNTGVSVRPYLPGSVGSVAQITLGVPFEVVVSTYAPKSGTVKVYLTHTGNKTRALLGSLRYTTTGADDRFTSLSLKAGPLTSAVKAGGGYQILTTFVSDDGALKAEGESHGLATVSATRSGAPSITRFTGPSSLRVGETGTWLLDAVAASGQTAGCRIWWGHDPSIVTPQAQGHSCKTNPLYKHTAVYKKAGTYRVAAEIRQADQQVATKWLTVVVK